MLPPLAIVALGAAALLLWRKKEGTVVAGGPPGTIIDVNPVLGVKNVQVSAGQTVRVNLPKEWLVLDDTTQDGMLADMTGQPMQRVAAHGIGGIVFTAASPGKQTIWFGKGGSTQTYTITFDVAPMSDTHAAGARFYRALPYREFWVRQARDPWWRWREEQWRLHRHWLPAWGPPPPPPADPVADVVDSAAPVDAAS